ncbi:hypothetical protein ACHAXR_006012, partial [Thalassiosira sp. AJA248-18]
LSRKAVNQGYFDDNYDNISRVAPELKEDFIYRSFAHIASDIRQKSIGDALQRCWYQKEETYHAIAFDPNSKRVIFLSKAQASMCTDEKTRNQTAEGEAPKKKEYLVILELEYTPTDEHENGHNLGIFTKLKRKYCTGGCVAGQGACRHMSERLWYQYYHWTEDRLGLERLSTMDTCSWGPGRKPLNSDVNQKIYEQQTVKHEKTIADQEAKMKRGAKRDCTEGCSGDYSIYLSAKKQLGCFTEMRCKKFFNKFHNDDTIDDELFDINVGDDIDDMNE